MASVYVEILFFILFLSKNGTSINITSHAESRLQSFLFKDYNPSVRPSIGKKSIDVRVDIALHHIIELNAASQTLRADIFFNLKWKDELLNWKEEDYDEIDSIVIPSNKVWVPDLAFLNAVKDAYDVGFESSVIQMNSKGVASYWGQKTKEFVCNIHTKKFPFDKHHCRITVGFVISNDEKIIVSPVNGSMGLDWYAKVPEWEIVKNSVEVEMSPDFNIDGIMTNYSTIHYHFDIQRNCMTCVMNIIFPVLLLSSLNLLTFLVPVTSGEKLAFPMSIFLTVAVFLTVINGSLPEAVDGPSYLAIWVTVELGFCALTLFCTVITLRMYNYKTKSVTIIQKFLNLSKMKTQPERSPMANLQMNYNNVIVTDSELKTEKREEERDLNLIQPGTIINASDLEIVCEKIDNALLLFFLIGQFFTVFLFIILIMLYD